MVIQKLKPWHFLVVAALMAMLGLYFLGAWLLESVGLCEHCSGYATSDEALQNGAGFLASGVFFAVVAGITKLSQ
jgi:hypothetical protein